MYVFYVLIKKVCFFILKVALDQLQQLIPGCTSFESSPGLPNKKSKAQILQKGEKL